MSRRWTFDDVASLLHSQLAVLTGEGESGESDGQLDKCVCALTEWRDG